MAARPWTESELRLALALYCQMPFGKMHSRNPDVIRLSERIGRTPSSVAMKLVNFASLDPEIVRSGRSGLGNASALDKVIWNKFQRDWDGEIRSATDELDDTTGSQELGADETPVPAETTRRAEVEVRRNQQLFRKLVLSNYADVCCMSGLSDSRLLVASHIVPWKDGVANRLNPRNGLCLSALHDKAFDRGLITVLPDYTIRVSAQLVKLRDDSFAQTALVACHGRKIFLPEKFRPAPEFLDWHNRRVFAG